MPQDAHNPPRTIFTTRCPQPKPSAFSPSGTGPDYESGDESLHACFPTACIESMLYFMENGASAEIAAGGDEGLIAVALFMGGGTLPNRAIVQSAGYARTDRSRFSRFSG